MEIPRGWGVLETKILEAKYEVSMGFPGGRGCKTRQKIVGGVWIFSVHVTAHSQFTLNLTQNCSKCNHQYLTCQPDIIPRIFFITFCVAVQSIVKL